MTTDTIFGNGKGDNQSGATPAETKEQGLLTALVGETQKYKSTEELAKAYVNADEFIAQLKEENRKLREQSAAAKTIDDVLERINKPAEVKPGDTPVTLSKDDIAALVEQTLTGRETQKTRESNLLQADRLMKEKFGEKAAEVFKAKAATPQKAQLYMELASQDPQEFVALFAGVSAPMTAAVDVGSTNTTTVMPSGNREGTEWTKEWANKVRREKPETYWSQDFQLKLQKQTLANPSLFFGN